MNGLSFYFGSMNGGKSAQAIMKRFNYLQKGFNVFLIKPIIDNRDNKDNKYYIKSRNGLECECEVFMPNTNLVSFCKKEYKNNKFDVIILDEAQFCSKKQIDQLKQLSLDFPIVCYGLKNNFKSILFEGSKRLFEIADNIYEIESVCKCGNKAIINARIIDGKLITNGKEIVIGGEEKYQALCYSCWLKLKNEQEKKFKKTKKKI